MVGLGAGTSMTGSTVTERVPLSRPRLIFLSISYYHDLHLGGYCKLLGHVVSIQPRYDWRLNASVNCSLGGHHYHTEDFVPVLQHAPDMVEQWLEGCTEATANFQHRVFRLKKLILRSARPSLHMTPSGAHSYGKPCVRP